jgi:tetratricopeptide (TPR) repeat protein
MLVLFALAFAADPSLPPAPPPVSQNSGGVPAQMLQEAIKLRQDGKAEASSRMLRELDSLMPPEMYGEYLYQRAISEEMNAQTPDAMHDYERVIELGDPRSADARLRLAMLLEDQGQGRMALDQIRQLSGLKGWNEADALTIELLQGMTEIDAGLKKRGIKHVQEALTALEGGDLDLWLRARARYMLARLLYTEAMDFHLVGSDRKAAKNLKKRATRMKAAEQQVVALIALNQVEWILASLLAMGDAYRDWAVELRGAPPPKHFQDADVVTWRNEINHYADNADTKAWHAYDEGLQLALRLQWESPRVAELKERRDEIPQR